MKQKVVILASVEGMDALAPILKKAQGVVLEHVTQPEWAARRLTESTPELLVLVHPLPGEDTVSFWDDLRATVGADKLPLTIVLASPEDLFDLEPLQEAGVRLVNAAGAVGEIERALSLFLRQAPRPDARVMVKVAIELSTGKILRIAQTVNVSRSGLLIRTHEEFPPGSTLDLKMELPGEKTPIEARAEVVRRADPKVEDVRGLGARFVWFRSGDESRFDRFMRRAVIDSASTLST